MSLGNSADSSNTKDLIKPSGKHLSSAKKESLQSLRKSNSNSKLTNSNQQSNQIIDQNYFQQQMTTLEEKNRQLAIDNERLRILVTEKQNVINDIQAENYQHSDYINEIQQHASRIKTEHDRLEQKLYEVELEKQTLIEKLKRSSNTSWSNNLTQDESSDNFSSLMKYCERIVKDASKLKPLLDTYQFKFLNRPSNLSQTFRNRSRRSSLNGQQIDSSQTLNNSSTNRYDDCMPGSYTSPSRTNNRVSIRKSSIKNNIQQENLNQSNNEKSDSLLNEKEKNNQEQEAEEMEEEFPEEEEEEEEEESQENVEDKKTEEQEESNHQLNRIEGLQMIQEEEEEVEEEEVEKEEEAEELENASESEDESEQVEEEEEGEEELEEDETEEIEDVSNKEENEESEYEEVEIEEEQTVEESNTEDLAEPITIVDETHKEDSDAPKKIQNNTFLVDDRTFEVTSKSPVLEQQKRVTFDANLVDRQETVHIYAKTPIRHNKTKQTIPDEEKMLINNKAIEVEKKSILKIRTSDVSKEIETVETTIICNTEINKINQLIPPNSDKKKLSINRRRSQVFELPSNQCEEPQSTEIQDIQNSKSMPKNKSIFKSKKKEEQEAEHKNKKKDTVSNYLEELVDHAAETDLANKKSIIRTNKSKSQSKAKIKVNVPNTDSESDDEEADPDYNKKKPSVKKKEQKTIPEKVIGKKNIEKNQPEPQQKAPGLPPLPANGSKTGLPPLPGGSKKPKRPIESVYDQNSKTTSKNVLRQSNSVNNSLISSTCSNDQSNSNCNDSIYSDQHSNTTEPCSPNLNNMLIKKLRLSPQDEDTENNSSLANNETASARRARKVVSYKEVPLNAKIRRDKNNKICIRALDKKSISNPNEDLAAGNSN